MGTLCRISLPVNSPKGIQGQLRQRLWDIDRLMSNNRDDSSLQAINRNPSLVSRKVDKELFNLIALARDIAAQSGGSFDLSVGPLVALWDIGGDRPRVPRPEEIEEAKKAVGYRNLLLDAEEGRVEFLKKGMRLDLGAIAKGYAADALADILAGENIAYGILDLGGNVLCYGHKPNGQPWSVGIQDPQKERGNILGTISIDGGSVVTSGVYERYFEEDGRRYHHLLDPETGYPAEKGLLSVSIVSQSSTLADAWATALFVAGPERARALLAEKPEIQAIMVFENRDIWLSPSLQNSFRLYNSAYRLIKGL